MTIKKERSSDIFVENNNRWNKRGVVLISWIFTFAKFVWTLMFYNSEAGSFSHTRLQTSLQIQ